jgi:hypothetical protein
MLPRAQSGYTEQEVLDQLRGKREPPCWSFRYDLLDHDNTYLRQLGNQSMLSASVSCNALADIKRTARFEMVDDPTIDYLSDRIMPWARLSMPGPGPSAPQNYGELIEARQPALWYKLDEALQSAARATVADSNSLTNQLITQTDVTLPEGWQPGQLAFLVFAVNDNADTITPPAGWTVLDSGPVETGTMEIGVWWRVLQSGDDDPHFIISDLQSVAGVIVTVDNVNTASPIAAVGTRGTRPGSQLTTDAGSVTTIAANQLVLGFFGEKSSSTTLAVSNMTVQASAFGSVSVAVSSETVAAAGVTGTRTATYDVASTSGYGLLVAVSTATPAAVNSAPSGSAFNGTVSSSAMPGHPGLLPAGGQSYNFTAAASGRVEVASSAFAGLDELTVCGWCKAASAGTDGVILSATPAATGGPSYVELRFDATGSIGSAANCVRGTVTMQGGSTAAAETIANVATTEVMFVAMTWRSGEGVRIFVDGVESAVSGTANSSVTGVVASAADTVLIGANGTATFYWGGYLDDVAMFDHALTASQLAELYRAGQKEGPYSDGKFVEWPLGVFLLSTPGRSIDNSRTVTRDIEAYDQLQALSDDLVVNRTTATSGDLYTTTITGLLSGYAINVTPSTKALPASRDWEPGTSKLTIINDLCAAINFEGVFFDEYGTAVVRPYVSPADRATEFTYRDDADSVQLPEVTETIDLFGVANKWVLVVSDADRVALTSTVTNDDPASATSTVNRGRTIVDFRTEQDAADQATLDDLVERIALEASQIYATVEFTTALMPFHSHSDVYTFAHDGLVFEEKFNETSWELPLTVEPGQHMKHSIRRVVNVEVT